MPRLADNMPDRHVMEVFRHNVPEEIRDEIKVRLLTGAIAGLDEFNACLQFILAHILAGEIPPEVADSALKYLQLMFSVIAVQTMAEGNKENPQNADIMDKIAKANKAAKRMIPKFTDATVDIEVTPAGFKARKG